MSYPVIERPIEAGPLAFPTALPGDVEPGAMPGATFEPSDAISRFVQPQNGTFGGGGGFFGGTGIGSLLQQLLQALETFFNASGLGSGGFPYGGNEPYFQNATGASVGDPHLSFNGSTWDNMGSQPDLLHSDSFQGGYQIATQATAPAANGVTYNQRATVTTNFGMTSVSLDNAGNATVTENGNAYALQAGETMDLGNGELVTRNGDGSVQVTCDNGNGGAIATTMRQNGQGIDVNATANNVNLGGALVAGPNQNGNGTVVPMNPMPHPRPIYRRY